MTETAKQTPKQRMVQAISELIHAKTQYQKREREARLELQKAETKFAREMLKLLDRVI